MAASGISATSSTDTKYPMLINGYLCYSAAEVRAARQMINPRDVDRTTGLPKRGDSATSSATATQSTAAQTTTAQAAAATRTATTTRSSFLDSLLGYSAQGTSSSDATTSRRGALLDILA